MKVYITSYNTVSQNESGGVQVRIKNFMNSIGRFVDARLFNIWGDKLDDCDILHVFKANIDSYGLIVQAKKKGKKVVLSSVVPQERPYVILHNLFWSRLLKLQTGYQIIKHELDLADCIIAQTEQEKEFISRYYKINNSKIVVIPNGISIEFKEENRNTLSKIIDISKPYLLQVGRFDENKNQLSVIRALKNTGIQVVFVGGPDPQYYDYYEKCVEEADEFFHFMGWLDNGSSEIQSAYMNARAVILPSKKEIFGNSLIEAGAAGAILVATSSLPLQSMGIADYCTIINPNSISDIREKVLLAMNKEKDLLQGEKIKAMFSWDNVSKRHFEVYQKVLKND